MVRVSTNFRPNPSILLTLSQTVTTKAFIDIIKKSVVGPFIALLRFVHGKETDFQAEAFNEKTNYDRNDSRISFKCTS